MASEQAGASSRKGDNFPNSIQSHEKTVKKSGSAAENKLRPGKEHSFLTDVADVRAMEHGLLQLLADFHSGKLQAFGGNMTFEKMDQIREQQEHLAKLHFELDMQQDMQRRDTEASRVTSNEKLIRLMDKLHSISSSIQSLQNQDSHQ